MNDSALAMPKYIDDGIFGRGVVRFWTTHGVLARVAMVLAAGFSFTLFTLGSQWLGVPPLSGFDGSLLREPSPFGAIVSVTILLLVATLVCTVIAGAVRFEMGLFAGAMGMMCISLRGGTMQSVLFEVNGAPGVFITLALELFLLSAMLMGLWAMLWELGKRKFVHEKPEYHHADESITSEPPAPGGDLTGNLIALFSQVVGTAIILLFLCQSESKKQVLASVAIASMLGACIAYMSFPTRPSIWFWTGPLIVGLIGYCIAATSPASDLATGNPQGFFAPLARPLPLDYASVGTAGAMLGYWMMRKPTRIESVAADEA
jgi:hypothetical protein